MKHTVELQSDSHNSYPGSADLRVIKSERGEFVDTLEVKLYGEDRTIEVKISDILAVLRAHKIST